jgi:hypothetical protein
MAPAGREGGEEVVMDDRLNEWYKANMGKALPEEHRAWVKAMQTFVAVVLTSGPGGDGGPDVDTTAELLRDVPKGELVTMVVAVASWANAAHDREYFDLLAKQLAFWR